MVERVGSFSLLRTAGRISVTALSQTKPFGYDDTDDDGGRRNFGRAPAPSSLIARLLPPRPAAPKIVLPRTRERNETKKEKKTTKHRKVAQ